MDIIHGNALIREVFPFVSSEVVCMKHVRKCGWINAKKLGQFLIDRLTEVTFSISLYLYISISLYLYISISQIMQSVKQFEHSYTLSTLKTQFSQQCTNTKVIVIEILKKIVHNEWHCLKSFFISTIKHCCVVYNSFEKGRICVRIVWHFI
jgi:hypothetical protein